MSSEARKTMSAASVNAVMEAAKSEMPNEQKRADLVAEIRKIHYDASLRKGFTPSEALVLCMKHTL